MRNLIALLLLGGAACAQTQYDLVLAKGTVIDPAHHLHSTRDIGIRHGRIAEIAPHIDPAKAHKVVSAAGLIVTPGLIDIHAHVFAGSGLAGGTGATGSVWPDSHTVSNCVTTVVDAGTSGAKNFPKFNSEVIDRSVTRVLAFLNIVGAGQAGAPEQDVSEMNVDAAVRMAKRYPQTIVGFKTAHYRGPDWTAVDRVLAAGTRANLPVMVDFGAFPPSRPFEELVTKKLRPGDIYTHFYLYAVPLLDGQERVREYLREARRRGVQFDVGHGMGSFLFRQAVPALKQDFMADSISTDLHYGDMNGPMSSMLNVMSKFLALGRSIDDVILRSTWNPAREIHRTELGSLAIGSAADIAVMRVEQGDFGYVDVWGGRMTGTQRLSCEMTLRDGKFVYDINGRTRQDWRALPYGYGNQADPVTDGILEKPSYSNLRPQDRKQSEKKRD